MGRFLGIFLDINHNDCYLLCMPSRPIGNDMTTQHNIPSKTVGKYHVDAQVISLSPIGMAAKNVERMDLMLGSEPPPDPLLKKEVEKARL